MNIGMFSLYFIYLFYCLFFVHCSAQELSKNSPATVLHFSLVFIQNLYFLSTTQSVGDVTLKGGKALVSNILVLASKRRDCFSDSFSGCRVPATRKRIEARRLLLGTLAQANRKQLFSTCSFYRAKDKVLSVATNNIERTVMSDNEVEFFDSNKVSVEDLKDLHSAYINRIYLSCIVFLNTPRSIVSFISWLYLCKVLVNAILLLLLLYFNPESFLLDFDMVQGCHLISDQELKTLNQLDIECDKVKDYFRQEVRSGNHARASVYEHCFNA